jgi:hypothetical protein
MVIRSFVLHGVLIALASERVEVISLEVWVLEVKDCFGVLEIPNDHCAIIACRCQNVWDYSVPGYRGDKVAFMVVWLSRSEDGGVL